MGIFSDSIKIQWKHFGHKIRLTLTKEDLNSPDLFEVLMKKVNHEVPKFEGIIACLDHNNRQLIIKSDADLRKMLEKTKDKLKIYTTLPERGSLPGCIGSNRVCRSYSVPPKGSPLSPPVQPKTEGELNESSENGQTPHQHVPLSRTERTSSGFLRNRHSYRAPSNCQPPSYGPYPIGWHQSYSSYNNAPGTGGVPPLNMMLNHVLTGGRYPPFHPGYGSRPFIF